MRLIIIFLLSTTVCFANQKDTANKPKADSAIVKQQQVEATIRAINFVISDMKESLYGKISAEEYAALLRIQGAYIKEKSEQFNPKPNNK